MLPGSRLSRLARRRWRHTWLVWLALAVQVVVISVLPDRPGLSEAAHLGSYALAAAFVAVNHRSVATLVIGVGGLLNLVAIAANGGVMPATRERAGGVRLGADPGPLREQRAGGQPPACSSSVTCSPRRPGCRCTASSASGTS